MHAFHRVLAPRYAATPERLRHVEHPGTGHWMTPAAWQKTAVETVGWIERFVGGAEGVSPDAQRG